MQLYLPYLVSLFTTVVGLVIWRYQLIAARRYEVVERAIIAAEDAASALTEIREAENDMEKDARVMSGSVRLAAWMATYQAIQQHESTFQELRAATRLVTMHLGEAAGSSFSNLLTLHKDVCNASGALLFRGRAERLFPTVSYEQGVVEWKRLVRSTSEGDPVAPQIADNMRKISQLGEQYLRPSIARRRAQMWGRHAK